METTRQLATAIEQHRTAISDLDEALGPYREGGMVGEQAATGLDSAAERYEQSSAAVAAAIIEYLPGGPRGPDDRLPLDGDASLRLAGSVAIDGIVAAQAALLIQLQEPEEPLTAQQTRPLTPLELASLGDLVTACAPLLDEIAGRHGEPPAGSTVATHADRILDRAGGDVVGTVRALLPVDHAVKDLAGQLAKAAADWVKDELPQVVQVAAGLRRLLARAWRQVTFKVHALVGEHGGELMEPLTGELSKWLDDVARSGTALAIGKLLKADDAIAAADQLVIDHPDKHGAAMHACEEVDDHHKRRRWAVPWLNRSLPACALLHPAGIAIQLGAGTTLLVYSLWLAHDHIDSPVLANVRLPKNPGLRTKIQEAVGS